MTLLFLLLLLLFLALFCLPRREETARIEPIPPEPVPHTGDVQVLLEWETRDDLDLYVTDPSGEIIYYGHRTSDSGGELDIDANVSSRMMVHPKENVYWPEGGAPAGTYKVEVKLYNWRTGDEIPFRVMIKHGDRVDNYERTMTEDYQVLHISSFTLDVG